MAAPSGPAQASILGPSTRITRRVDIYEEDASTPFKLLAPFMDGSVGADQTRAERRTAEVTFENIDGSLDNYPGGFWYDKIIKIYRGLVWDGLTPSWVAFDSTNYLHTSDAPGHNVAGSTFKIRMRLSLADWTPGVQWSALATKWNTTGNQRSWYFGIRSDTQRLTVYYSTTGTNEVGVSSTVAPGFADGSVQYLGVDVFFDTTANNKVFTFLTSTDGVVWTPVGDPVVEASTTAVKFFDSSAPIRLGAQEGGGDAWTGNLYYVGIFDDARTIVDLDLTALENGAGAMQDTNGIAFAFNNGVSKVKGGTYEEQSWETQVGEFMIDRIDTQDFPHSVSVACRDYTKKLIEAKFPYATAFTAGTPVEDVIRTIALNANITKFILPETGIDLARDALFEADTPRWDAIKKLAEDHGYEVYFDPQGYLVMRLFQDPVSAAPTYTFETGEFGNLAKYQKSSSSTRIYNQIVVRGEATDVIPVTYVAENHEPSSPTSIENLNQTKTFTYASAFITTEAQAQVVAEQLLAIHSLESFEVSLTSLVIPWLDVGEIVEFLDPDPNPGDPTRYLLSSFTLPLKLGAMTALTKRVTVVG